MREIKFRAWYNNKMDYRPHGFDEYFGETMPINEAIECAIEHDKQILMQYTGLKDKNDKEIYEGDLVKTHYFYQGLGENMGVIECEKEFKSVIEYYQNDCAFLLVSIEDGGIVNFAEIQEPREELEVIGNIYENPELLEGK